MRDTTLREDADIIIKEAISSVLPNEAVHAALKGRSFGPGKIFVVAVGKAGWQMGRAAGDILGKRISAGIVITKYDHVMGDIEGFTCFEAGHPIPDNNTFAATEAAIKLVSNLTKDDTVIFLVSGGGSALFEKPLISGDELASVTSILLGCGADIVEINTIRKRLSAVKGGRFAKLCEPAKVFSIVLSDVLGDPLDMIASGPAYPDSSTCESAIEIVKKYKLQLSDNILTLLQKETPKTLENVETMITGSVKQLCKAAARSCEKLGYRTCILTDRLNCEAKEAGVFLAAVAKSHSEDSEDIAFIAGGETVVTLTGTGLGGRNQELALASAPGIEGLPNVAIFSIGSDGTDGPTDAAGGYADCKTASKLRKCGLKVHEVLADNDAYHALEKTGGLIKTGATGTNVNDVSIVLIRKTEES